LQQVASQAFYASARPVEAVRLPVPARRSPVQQALMRIGHIWVLHKKPVRVGLLAGLAVLTGLGAYQLREPIATGVATASTMVQGRFAAVGFGIRAIEITGQKLTRERDIFALLTLGNGSSTLNYDVDKARQRLTWLRAVESASVRKVYPDRLEVTIVEREPVARWRAEGVTHLVDAEGRRIGIAGTGFADLPLVIGAGAADDAQVMIRALAGHSQISQGVAAMSRIGDRRWDLIYYTGLRVQLPENGVGPALDRLESYQRDYALLDRDVTVIDLRIPGMVALTPGEDAKKQIEAERKAAGKKK